MTQIKTCEEDMFSSQAQTEEISLADQITIIKQEPNEQFVSLAVAASLQEDHSVFSSTYSGEGPEWQNENMQLKCEEYGFGVRCQSELHNHQILHAQEEPAENGCTSVIRYIEDHSISKSKKLFTCEECGKIFQLKHHLAQHQAIHTPDNRYPCATCGKSYKHKRDLIRHQHVHTRKTPLKCEKCGKCFELKHHLRRHEFVHTTDQRYVCFMCSRTYKHQRDLIRHHYGHRGDKPLTCEHCGKCFELKHYLSWHELVNDTNKPFPCAYCGKSCNRTKCPEEEEELKDTQGGDFLQCNKCDKSFKPNDLLRHQAVHSTERPYKCEVCGKSYKYRRDLTRHQPTHLETKPYSCDVCGKGFLQKRYMTRHRFTHEENEWARALV